MCCIRVVVSFVALAGLLVSCGTQFPTRYERIENDRLRPLAFVFDNKGLAEAAPGDTVTLHAYFTGVPVNDIEWSMTSPVILNTFGVDTFSRTGNLSIVGEPRWFTGGETDSVILDFIVPPNTIREAFSRVTNILSLLPANIHDSVPQQFRDIPVSTLITVMELLSGTPSGNSTSESDSLGAQLAAVFFAAPQGASPDSLSTPQPINQGLAILLQLFTAQFKILARVNGRDNIEATYAVRYNSRMIDKYPDVLVNRNPQVEWIGVYKIKGTGVVLFDPLKESHLIEAFYPLHARDTIPIEIGFSYFLGADSSTAVLDSGQTIQGRKEPEIIYYDWFYRNDDVIAGVPQDSLLALSVNTGNSTVQLLPPVDTRMKNFGVWVVAYDSKIGEKLRPIGFAFRHATGVFAYSDAYLKAHR